MLNNNLQDLQIIKAFTNAVGLTFIVIGVVGLFQAQQFPMLDVYFGMFVLVMGSTVKPPKI